MGEAKEEFSFLGSSPFFLTHSLNQSIVEVTMINGIVEVNETIVYPNETISYFFLHMLPFFKWVGPLSLYLCTI